jgi:Protein of unknown function (DUF2971)
MKSQLFGLVIDPNLWVYHYTSRSTALEHILSGGTIRLGSFLTVNDPRESKDWYFSVALSEEADLSPEDTFVLLRQITQLVKGHCKMVCMSTDDKRAAYLDGNYGFYRGYAKPRMWAQYGQNHAGVCLIFDRNLLDKTIRNTLSSKGEIYSGRVHYRHRNAEDADAFNIFHDQIRRNSIDRVVREMVNRYFTNYFFTKAEDWANECEWRWLLRGTDNKPEYVNIAESIRGVVVGSDFPETDKSSVLRLAEKFGIPVAKVIWMNGYPTVHPVV